MAFWWILLEFYPLYFQWRKIGGKLFPAFLIPNLTVQTIKWDENGTCRTCGTRKPWARQISWVAGMGEVRNLSSRKWGKQFKLGKSAQTLINQLDLMNFTFWYKILTSCWPVRLHVRQLAIAEVGGWWRESDSPSDRVTSGTSNDHIAEGLLHLLFFSLHFFKISLVGFISHFSSFKTICTYCIMQFFSVIFCTKSFLSRKKVIQQFFQNKSSWHYIFPPRTFLQVSPL